jgi:hypothetical protein
LLLCLSYLPLGVPNWVVICPHQLAQRNAASHVSCHPDTICHQFVGDLCYIFFTHKACHLSFSPNLKYILLCRMDATFFSGFLSASTCLRLLYLSFIHTPSVLYYSAYEIWSKSQINMFDQVYIWQNHIYDIHNMKLYFVALLTILFYIIDVNMFSYIISQIFNIWFWPILYAQ